MKHTKEHFKKSITNLLNDKGTDEVLSEAALPAYAHKNFMIDYIFWKRVEIASNFVSKNIIDKSEILDFGCGTGVFSYEMATKGHSITAIDLNLKPVNLLKSQINYPTSIEFIEGDFFQIEFTKKFDFIVALDVLEHISLNDLPLYIDQMKKILNPNGYIVVSGPTENILYKIGRKIAGDDFTGDYHHTNIGDIQKVFQKSLTVKKLAKLIFPFVLFEVFSAKVTSK